MKHTKVNWKAVGAFVISEIIGRYTTSKTDICSTSNVNDLLLREQIANANLIATAPDLLNALKAFPDKLDNQTNEQFYNCCASWIRTHKIPAIDKTKTTY